MWVPVLSKPYTDIWPIDDIAFELLTVHFVLKGDKKKKKSRRKNDYVINPNNNLYPVGVLTIG